MSTIDEEPPTAETLKELGNTAVKNRKFEEAVLHYTRAIKVDPTNFTLYSNRSYAFLKVKQYYLALEDARTAINLNPTWPKAFFRKGEVEFTTGHYEEAYHSYKEALILKPGDINLIEAMNKTAKELLKNREADKKIPWVGAGIGIIFGAAIVVADCLFTRMPTHPMLMALVTMVIAVVGYAIARSYRSYVRVRRDSLLQPPADLVEEYNKRVDSEEIDEKDSKRTPRYTKSQARQRYKKGKL